MMDVTNQENVLHKFLIFDFRAFFEGDVFFFLNLLKDVYSKKVSCYFQCKGTVEKTK